MSETIRVRAFLRQRSDAVNGELEAAPWVLRCRRLGFQFAGNSIGAKTACSDPPTVIRKRLVMKFEFAASQ